MKQQSNYVALTAPAVALANIGTKLTLTVPDDGVTAFRTHPDVFFYI
jgi:hypothetical protein